MEILYAWHITDYFCGQMLNEFGWSNWGKNIFLTRNFIIYTIHVWDWVRRILWKTEMEKSLGMLPFGRTMFGAL
jgi:hypothetical protein